MAPTASRQRNAVSEGIALGLVMCGRVELPFDKMGVDLSFVSAWRKWPAAHRFPQVGTDIRNGKDGVWVMTHATETKHVSNLYWERSGNVLRIVPRASSAGETINPVEVAETIDGEVSVDEWLKLAEDFLARFER